MRSRGMAANFKQSVESFAGNYILAESSDTPALHEEFIGWKEILDPILKILEFEFAAFGIGRKELVYFVFVIRLGLRQGNGSKRLVYAVHLFPAFIKEGNQSLDIGAVPFTKTEKQITVFQDNTIFLVLPDSTANLIGVEFDHPRKHLGSKKQNPAHFTSQSLKQSPVRPDSFIFYNSDVLNIQQKLYQQNKRKIEIR